MAASNAAESLWATAAGPAAPAAYEHSCLRCSLLRPGPDQRRRIVAIRANVLDHHEEPVLGLSTWPIERLQAFTTDAGCQQLEAVRVVAQEHAYGSDRPREVRRQWAKLSLLANRRMHGDGPGDRARAVQQDFMLRMWVIDHLGSDDKDPDWSPEKLAADTLDALALTPPHARALTSSRHELPIEQIRELRRHKNLTAHLERLINHLHPGSTRDQLLLWAETRRLLP